MKYLVVILLFIITGCDCVYKTFGRVVSESGKGLKGVTISVPESKRF